MRGWRSVDALAPDLCSYEEGAVEELDAESKESFHIFDDGNVDSNQNAKLSDSDQVRKEHSEENDDLERVDREIEDLRQIRRDLSRFFTPEASFVPSSRLSPVNNTYIDTHIDTASIETMSINSITTCDKLKVAPPPANLSSDQLDVSFDLFDLEAYADALMAA